MYIKNHIWVLVTVISLLFLAALPPVWYNSVLSYKGQEGNFVVFNVESGITTGQLAQRLYNDGFIKSPLVFNIYAKMQGHDVNIKSGKYLIGPSMSMVEIIEKMVSGDVVNEDVRITIPEGTVLEAIAKTFEDVGLISSEAFLKDAKIINFKEEYQFLEGFPDENDLEGLLFPDTYFLPRDKSAKFYIRVMLSRFKEVYFDDSLISRREETDLSVYDTVILASIVEAEAKLDSEKPVIAGVFYNRLKMRKPFESCATVEYALKEHKLVLSLKDLEIESPYNTYKYEGLPPGPIGAPGLASLYAVINPEDVEYLYFVANGDGTHTFSKSFEEHVKAARRIQRGG